MKRLLLVFFIGLATLQGFAQGKVGSLTFIPKVGINLATVAGEPTFWTGEELKPKMRIGVAAGIDAEYQMSELMSLSAGVLYSMQGHNFDDVTYQRDYSATIHYINVPVMMNFYVLKGLALKMGVQPGYALARKVSYEQKLSEVWSSSSLSTSYANFDLAVPVGIAYDIDRVRIDARYNFGLLNVNNLDNGKFSNRVIQVTLGYRL